jgi:PhnB protein
VTTSTDVQVMTPYLCAKGAEKAIAFYGTVFGAEVAGDLWRDPSGGRVGHAELHLGGMRFFVSDEYAELDVLSPQSRGGTTVAFVVIVDDIDKVWAKALAHGATVERDVTVDNGMRGGWLRDPWGHRWNVGQLVPGG